MRTIPYWLSLGLIFTIPFKELLVIPGLGSLSLILGLAAAGCWLLAVLLSGRVRPISIFHLAAFAFFLWNGISILWTINGGDSVDRALTYARMALFIWMLWDLYDSREKIWSAAQAYVLGAWVNMGSVLFNFINDVEAYRNANSRFAATGFNTNETGLLLALALPLAWYLAVSSPFGQRMPWLLRWLNFLYLPVGLFAIVLTASRGSMIATVPILLVILISLGNTGRAQRLLLFIGVVIAGFYLINFIPEENLARLSTTGEEISTNDLNGRMAVWQDGFQIFDEHMLVGTGAGTFRRAVDTGKAPHNVFVAIGVDLGLVGLTLFLIVLLLVGVALLRYPGAERLIWLSLLFAWLTGSMVGNWEYENVSWLFLCLIVKGAALQVQNRSINKAERPRLPRLVQHDYLEESVFEGGRLARQGEVR